MRAFVSSTVQYCSCVISFNLHNNPTRVITDFIDKEIKVKCDTYPELGGSTPLMLDSPVSLG